MNIGRAVVDWIADYYEIIENLPVLSQVRPGEIRAQIAPSRSAAAARRVSMHHSARHERNNLARGYSLAIAKLLRLFSCQCLRTSNSRRLAFFGFGVQGMLWATSPACTELETQVLDWLVPMLGLPEKFLSSSEGGGVIQDTASSSSLCAMLAARERATGYRQ